MTSGKMNQTKKHNIKASLLLSFFFIFPAHALEMNKPDGNKPELSKILHQFAQNKRSTVDFKEEKHAFYLDEPIKSSGYLQFSAPNNLYKFISKPEKISQKINGNTLEIINSSQTHTINLDEHPEFSIILRAIISLLSGDHSALKKDFKIDFKGKASSWTLFLSPHNSYVSSYVESIKMVGNKNKLTKIIVTESNKDHSITHLYNHR